MLMYWWLALCRLAAVVCVGRVPRVTNLPDVCLLVVEGVERILPEFLHHSLSHGTMRNLFLVTILLAVGRTSGFAPVRLTSRCKIVLGESKDGAPMVDAEPMLSSVTAPEAVRLKQEFLELAESTKRGFTASSSDRERANELIYALAAFNPSTQPASPYYEGGDTTVGPSLAGKWTLVYTDAPDITSLDSTPTAKLGRIGQECSPPYIKNVIEWKRPAWASSLPFTGTDESRILQRVVTKATASPNRPMLVDLVVAGFELQSGEAAAEVAISNLADTIVDKGLPVGLLSINPIKVEGSVTVPFGQFEVLYLDEEMRIIKTGQNFVAANIRDREEWF